MNKNLFGTVIILSVAVILLAQHISADNRENSCTSRTSCSECLSAGPKCAWCKGKLANRTALDRRRCDEMTELQHKCNGDDIYYPILRPNTIKSDTFGVKNDGKIVQMRPQHIRLPIKPNSPQIINVEYQQAGDYPVDLYYLMDLTNTMKVHKTKLETLGEELGKTMEQLTKNYQLGFGSFVDKRVAPFMEEHPAKLNNPCSAHGTCERTYGFINHMKLSQDPRTFTKEVKKRRNSANKDDPEGTLDAIMQALVCTNEIGWRSQARKIILVATDEEFHMAGDGKLGGLVLPNDGRCHLNSKGEYTESEEQDYPSISHINWKAKHHKVNIIFAVTSQIISVYKLISKSIEESYIGELNHESSNVLDIIRDRYRQISSTITLRANATDNIQVSYRPHCKNNNAENIDNKFSEKGNTCENITAGTKVNFDIEINLSACPKRLEDRHQILQVSPVGINESLFIELDMQCECDCGVKEVASKKCSDVGVLECGTCTCPKNKFGISCKCDIARLNVSETDDTPCKMPNSTKVCSGRGSCICGQCQCDDPTNEGQEVDGEYCEFDNFNCKQDGGKICGGGNRGKCVAGPGGGQCHCVKGWRGETCSCPDNDDDCKSESGEVCSGKGVCNCGVCDCQVTTKFYGRLCEDWIPLAKCNEPVRDCVLCDVFPNWAEEERLPCQQCKLTVERNTTGDDRNEQKCPLYKDNDSCYYYYFQELTIPSDDGRIRFTNERECPQPVNALVIGGSIVGSILAIGIALLFIFKTLTILHDRREYAKFMKERENVKFGTGVNPYYVAPVGTYGNPMYNVSDESPVQDDVDN